MSYYRLVARPFTIHRPRAFARPPYGPAARRPPRPLPLVAAPALRLHGPRGLPPPLHRPRRRPRGPSGPRAHHQRARGVQAPVGGRAGAGHSKKYETKITDNSDGKMGRKEVLTTAAKHSQKIDKATQQHAQPSRTTRKSQRQQRQQGGRTTLSRLTVAAGCPSLRLHGAHSL